MSTITPQEAPQNFGEVFTRRWVVDTLLDLTGYTVDRDLGALTAVEPSAGSGAFLLPMVERLVASARQHNRELRSLEGSIRAWELQSANVQSLRSEVRQLLTKSGASELDASHLSHAWVIEGDFLLPDGDGLLTAGAVQVEADVVIGNP
ncbi:MAG: hypothetical protein LCH87_07990, partial [Actinobacteria bacterium]|nr:hypothetical protein [Actinomycetota bacterium]